MDIHVFDKSFNRVGIIDSYETLIWLRDYHSVGSFELHTSNQDEYTMQLLQKGNILVKDNDPNEAMEIDSLYLTEKTIAKGRSIDGFLADRIAWQFKDYTGTPEVIMRSLVNENAVSATQVARRIPSLVLGQLVGLTGRDSTEQPFGKPISDLLSEISLKHDLGWRVRFSHSDKKYYFEVYQGPDHSINQDILPRMLFSTEYENIFNLSYTNSDTSYKTVGLVTGAGEEPKVRTVINDTLTGFERKEVHIDAGDISRQYENGNTIPTATYTNLLIERGNTKLAEMEITQSFECDVSTLSNLQYRFDYDLGHKVTIYEPKWGVVLNTRIVAVEEIYENGVEDIRVTFGKMIPTLSNILNKVVTK